MYTHWKESLEPEGSDHSRRPRKSFGDRGGGFGDEIERQSEAGAGYMEG